MVCLVFWIVCFREPDVHNNVLKPDFRQAARYGDEKHVCELFLATKDF